MRWVWATLVGGLAIGCARGEVQPSAADAANLSEAGQGDAGKAVPAGEPAGTYLGRTLATTMSFHGADWLTRPERDAEEDTTAMHAQLGLSSGQIACDIGAGNGYHALRMAKAVAPRGRVLAVDIQPEMLAMLRARAEEQGINNVELVEGKLADPRLAAGACDLILLVDVYHEFSDPAAMLGHLARALSPGGRIALLEFRGEDPEVPIKALHKMTKAQIVKEFAASDLQVVGEFDGLPWQHLMFFGAQ